MNEQIFNDLNKSFNTARLVTSLPDDETPTYDILLLELGIRGITEEDKDAARLLQIRLRKDEDKDEELVIVTNGQGFTAPSTTKALEDMADMLDTLNTKMSNIFYDRVLIWKWLE